MKLAFVVPKTINGHLFRRVVPTTNYKCEDNNTKFARYKQKPVPSGRGLGAATRRIWYETRSKRGTAPLHIAKKPNPPHYITFHHQVISLSFWRSGILIALFVDGYLSSGLVATHFQANGSGQSILPQNHYNS